ncbi:MAG: hypothetical protein L0207_05165 [Chlamydiae bacterium]|nr:hypothetical protein [Chlamydiota bacterium]
MSSDSVFSPEPINDWTRSTFLYALRMHEDLLDITDEQMFEIYRKVLHPSEKDLFIDFLDKNNFSQKKKISIVNTTLKMSMNPNTCKLSESAISHILNIYETLNPEEREIFFKCCEEKGLTGEKINLILPAVLEMSKGPGSNELQRDTLHKILELCQQAGVPGAIGSFHLFCKNNKLAGPEIIPIFETVLKMSKNPVSQQIDIDAFIKVINIYSMISQPEVRELFFSECEKLGLVGNRITFIAMTTILRISKKIRSKELDKQALMKILKIYSTFRNKEAINFFYDFCEKKSLTGQRVIPIIDAVLEISRNPDSDEHSDKALEVITAVYETLEGPESRNNFVKSCRKLELFGWKLEVAYAYCEQNKLNLYNQVTSSCHQMMRHIQHINYDKTGKKL